MDNDELTKKSYKEVTDILNIEFANMKMWMKDKFVTKDKFYNRLMILSFIIFLALLLGGYGAGLKFMQILSTMKMAI